jgi:hypothetical protein
MLLRSPPGLPGQTAGQRRQLGRLIFANAFSAFRWESWPPLEAESSLLNFFMVGILDLPFFSLVKPARLKICVYFLDTTSFMG